MGWMKIVDYRARGEASFDIRTNKILANRERSRLI